MDHLTFSESVVTLYEKDYHFGVATLINSLSNSGFSELVIIGYRGELPPWVKQLSKISDDYYSSGKITIKFIYLSTIDHFGYYKPYFMVEVLLAHPTLQKIFYFDPDITIISPWPFFSKWADCGICLCLDNCFPFIHPNHPWRNEWNLMKECDDQTNSIDYYVNSGYIGLDRKNIDILKKWMKLTEHYKHLVGDLASFDKTPWKAIKTDQDLLNATIQLSGNFTYSIIGTEGMGFTQPAYLMSHAVHNVKPWRKKFTKALFIHGRKPDMSEKNYFKHCKYPINIYTKSLLFVKLFDLKIATIIGRLIGY